MAVPETLYMAGLYRFGKDISIPHFVILTRPAASDISFIHERMPVILSKDTHEAWLNKHMDHPEVLSHSMENLIYEGENLQPTLF